jgi:hypothetical protein
MTQRESPVRLISQEVPGVLPNGADPNREYLWSAKGQASGCRSSRPRPVAVALFLAAHRIFLVRQLGGAAISMLERRIRTQNQQANQ